MGESIKKAMESKRETIIYLVIFLWACLGGLGLFYLSDLTHLSVYFLSLTGFIGTFIFGETIRKSDGTSIFQKGRTSKRELLTYIIITIWMVIGVVVIIQGGDIIGAAAYFGSLTPFVGAYILAETYTADENPFLKKSESEDYKLDNDYSSNKRRKNRWAEYTDG